MSVMRLFFCFVLMLLSNISCGEELDQFSYDEQLLGKMVKMELKVEQMEKWIKDTQTDVKRVLEKVASVLDNKTEEFNLLKGRVDMPMVAFSAYNPVDRSMETGQILVLQTVRLNKGEGYDKVIGVFTAPATGLYFFNAHVCTYSGKPFYYDIVLENNHIAKSTQYNTATHDCSSVSAITMVTAGQRVWVKCTSGNTNTQLYESSYWETSFSGVLLQK